MMFYLFLCIFFNLLKSYKFIFQFTFFLENNYQLINQSNFYSANMPGVARLSGATARSVFKCEVVEVVP